MTDDSNTEARQKWLRELPMHSVRRLEPPPETHVLTRKHYTNAANTDIRKTFEAARKALAAA